jgi:hypothetical protein
MRSAVAALVALQGLLAMGNMAHGALAHLLSVVAGLIDVLLAELTNHRCKLLVDFSSVKPTSTRR